MHHPENTRAPLPELARLRQREIDGFFFVSVRMASQSHYFAHSVTSHACLARRIDGEITGRWCADVRR